MSESTVWKAPTEPGIFERDRAFYLDVMTTNITAASLPFPARLKLGQQSPSVVPRFYMVSRGVMPKISPIFTTEATVIGWLRAAGTALAVERFRGDHGGTRPARLEELAPSYCETVLTDPADGGPLRFEMHETGYVVHSSGKSFRVER